MWLSLGAVVVSTGCRWCRVQGLPVVFRGVFPAFCPLSRFAFGGLLAKMPLFRILRGFWRGFVVRMYIYMGWGLCVVCGAFYVRERLGGFGACGVFCLLFSSLVLLSCFLLLSCLASCLACFPALCLAFLASWLVLGFLSFGLLFLFPFRTICKKKGRNSLRPLSFCCGLLV